MNVGWSIITSFFTVAKTSHNEAQHEYELALHEEPTGQGKFEQPATRSNRKSGIKETWPREKQCLVSQDNFGFDLDAMEADAKNMDQEKLIHLSLLRVSKHLWMLVPSLSNMVSKEDPDSRMLY